MNKRKQVSLFSQILHQIAVFIGASLVTLVFFLILPLMQTIAKSPELDMVVQNVDVAEVPPPPAIEEEKPQEQPQEELKPELSEVNDQQLSLDELSLALNPGLSDGMLQGDFTIAIKKAAEGGNANIDELFSVADLDQKPRAIYQPAPVMTKEMRKAGAATVYVVFIVDQEGKVQEPKVQSTTNPIFDRSAVNAVKQWKFEPGKNNGKAVRFRMRVPVTFAQGK